MGLTALRNIKRGLGPLFCQRDSATLEMRNKIVSNETSWRGAVGLPVDCAHRIDIALPNGEQLLDVGRFGQGFAERRNEIIGPRKTLARATGETEQPWAAIVFGSANTKRLAVF